MIKLYKLYNLDLIRKHLLIFNLTQSTFTVYLSNKSFPHSSYYNFFIQCTVSMAFVTFEEVLTWHYYVLLETFLTGLVSLPVCVLGLIEGTLSTIFEYLKSIIGCILERIYDQTSAQITDEI